MFCQIYQLWRFRLGLPVAVNNPVPATQAGFQQFRAIYAFASKAATNAVIVGTPVII